MNKLIALLFAATCLTASAVNLQICWSGYNHDFETYKLAGSPWQSVTTTIGGSTQIGGEYVDLRETVPYADGSSSRWTGTVIYFGQNENNPRSIQIRDYNNSPYMQTFSLAESVRVGGFGWQQLPWINNLHEYNVVTFRGDPYSTVVNQTGKDRVVNGVTIAAGSGERLILPFVLKMEEVENIEFFDLKTGNAFTPVDQSFAYDEHDIWYRNGCYKPYWCGDFGFRDGNEPHHVATNIDQIVYADIKGDSDEGKVLYAANNEPVYAGSVNITTNIQLMTWWDFDQDAWGGSPKAMINGEVVCNGHSTTHIISYTVNANNLKVSEMSNKGYVYFTMSQTPGSGKSGGSCTMRCWDVKAGSGTAGYSNASADHRAEVSAGLGVASFKIEINVMTGKWKLTAL